MDEFAKLLNDTIVSNLLGVGIVSIYGIIALAISFPIKLIVRRLPGSWGKSLGGPLGDLIQIAGLGVGLVIGARAAGVDITVLLAITAIITAGLSLALDTNVKDALASVKILLSNYYKVGESISFDALTGRVHHISLFATTLYVSDRGLVTVANSKVADGPISNHSREPVEMAVRIPILTPHNRRSMVVDLRTRTLENPMVTGVKVVHAWEQGGSEIYTLLVKVKDYDKRRETVTEVSIALTDFLEGENFVLGEYLLQRIEYQK